MCNQLANLYGQEEEALQPRAGFSWGTLCSCSCSLSFCRWSRQGLVPGSGAKLGSIVPSPETSR